MREYKFRGFDSIGNKGWVYGDLVHNKKITETGLEDRVILNGEHQQTDMYSLSSIIGKKYEHGYSIRHIGGGSADMALGLG